MGQDKFSSHGQGRHQETGKTESRLLDRKDTPLVGQDTFSSRGQGRHQETDRTESRLLDREDMSTFGRTRKIF